MIKNNSSHEIDYKAVSEFAIEWLRSMICAPKTWYAYGKWDRERH